MVGLLSGVQFGCFELSMSRLANFPKSVGCLRDEGLIGCKPIEDGFAGLDL